MFCIVLVVLLKESQKKEEKVVVVGVWWCLPAYPLSPRTPNKKIPSVLNMIDQRSLARHSM
jgi:hypothetical protein